MKIKNLVYTAVFCVLIIIGAFIKIQLPLIPITFQVFFVLLTGLLMKYPISSLAPLLYMLLGLLGIPVFTKGGGIWYIFEKSFGYIVGFIFAALFISLLMKKIKTITYIKVFLVCVVGIMVIYIFGIPYFYIIQNVYLAKPLPFITILKFGFLVTLPSDIISAIVASIFVVKVKPVMKKLGIL